MSGAGLLALMRERGPLTVAAFMDLALYHPEHGYYARAAQRSGRTGDFFTSVDVGPLFGSLLAVQIAEMGRLLPDAVPLDLVEAGAGNGRLSRDILEALKQRDPDIYARARLHLVEASPQARGAQRETLGGLQDRLSTSAPVLPDTFTGVLVANELFDAMPVHQIVMRDHGLREVYVEVDGGRPIAREGPLSTNRLQTYFDDLDISLEPGWRAEVSLAAVDWMAAALERLTRGFLIVVDYGHQARELYSVTHSAGTLTSYSRHVSTGPESSHPAEAWLSRPGEQDLTAHVDFTSLIRAAETGGGRQLALMDQMYFLIALAADRLERLDLKERLALKTLVMPGGLGTTMKVLVIGKQVGAPPLIGCSSYARLT